MLFCCPTNFFGRSFSKSRLNIAESGNKVIFFAENFWREIILANDFFGDFARSVTPTYLKFLTILTKLDSDGSVKDCEKKNLFSRNKIPHF